MCKMLALIKSHLLQQFSSQSKKTLIHKYHKKIIPLTQDRYNVIRKNYAILNDADITYFENILGPNNIQRNSLELDFYNTDFLKSVKGRSQIMLKPQNSEEIANILQYCNTRKLAVCPQAGNTGLVGGSVPVFDEIIVSLQRLNHIESIDEITGIIICQAGCILEYLQSEASKHNLCLPLDLGSKGTCQIGGNLSTNAGGLRVLRYGNLHGSVSGVEVCLANGQILDLLSNFKKDNTGYHLKHLFIGSEGTLGILSKCAILCPAISKSRHVAFLGLSSFHDVLKTYLNAKKYLGEILSACEMIDQMAYKKSISTYNLNPPIPEFPFYMLIETSGSFAAHDEEKFNLFLENGMKNGEIIDGVMTGEETKMKSIWQIRELVPVSLISDGYCYKYDISLPLRDFYDIVLIMRKRMENYPVDVSGYGHLGDSNLHLNISCQQFTQEIYEIIEPYVYEYTSKLKGSISAEHGIGFLKRNYLPFSKSKNAIELMTNCKTLLDPNGILNPYKVLPDIQK